MKKITILYSFICWLIGFQLYAQECAAPIPADAKILKGNVSLSATETGNFWVCDGADVEASNAGDNKYFVEDGGVLNMTETAQGKIYINEGGMATIESSSNEIYVAANATAIINGNGNTIYLSEDGNVEVGGASNSLDEEVCGGSLTFDYSEAPAGGCAGLSIDDLIQRDDFVKIGPSPSTGTFYYEILHEPLKKYTVFDLQGRIIQTYEPTYYQFEGVIDLQDFPTGTYFVRFDSDAYQIYTRVMIAKN